MCAPKVFDCIKAECRNELLCLSDLKESDIYAYCE